jgi:hypothetical protein
MKALSGQQTVLAKPPNSVIGDRSARLAAIHAAKCGEHGIVKAAAHAKADQPIPPEKSAAPVKSLQREARRVE